MNLNVDESVVDQTHLAQLNERQRQCLRLVHQNFEAKEIARRLGLSPHTVVEHLREARRITGVSRSMHAARALAEHEAPDQFPNRIVSNADGVADDPPFRFDVTPSAAAAAPPATMEFRNDLNWLVRLCLLIAIAIGAVILVGALFLGIDTAQTLIRHQG